MNSEHPHNYPENTPPMPEYEPTAHLSRWQQLGRRAIGLFRRQRPAQQPGVNADFGYEEPSPFTIDEAGPITAPADENIGPTITIAHIVQANELRYFDEGGNEIGKPDRYSSKKAALNAFGLLQTLYLETGKNHVSSEEALRLSGMQPGNLMSAARRFWNCAPTEAFTFELGGYVFGNVALASRIATDEELKVYRQQRADIAAAKKAAKQEQAPANEEGAIPEIGLIAPEQLTALDADHAQISVSTSVGEKLFIIPLESDDAIIAAQCLEVVGALPDQPFSHQTVVSKIIEKMRPEDRTQLEIQQSGFELNLKDRVLETLRTLTNKMCVTHEPFDRKFRRLTDPFDVVYRDSPPEQHLLKNSATSVIFPPGTERHDIYSYGQVQEVSPAEWQALQEAATQLVALARTPREKRPSITADEAIKYLDLVMDPAGKRAVSHVLLEQYRSNRANRTLRTIRRSIIKPALGAGYGSAIRNRTIAGNHATGDGKRAIQVSGSLPPTTKWHVGMNLRNEEHQLPVDHTDPA